MTHANIKQWQDRFPLYYPRLWRREILTVRNRDL